MCEFCILCRPHVLLFKPPKCTSQLPEYKPVLKCITYMDCICFTGVFRLSQTLRLQQLLHCVHHCVSSSEHSLGYYFVIFGSLRLYKICTPGTNDAYSLL